MRHFTFNRGTFARRRVWITDVRRADYSPLLADPKVEQLDIRFLVSGRELLREWKVRTPDVCLVNLQMPGFSGFDLVEMIQPFPEGVTVCLMTDQYVLEDEVRALSLGVHSYLCKPLEAALFFEFCLHPRARHEAVLLVDPSSTVPAPGSAPDDFNRRNAERRLLD
jgi:DNA-binding response OmpR family regulator